MSSFVRNTLLFIVFIGIQVFVLFKVKPLHQFVVPYLYFLYILWLPFNTPRIGLTLIGFLFGLTLDFFQHSPGFHAATCSLIAYVRPFLISILISQEGADQNYRSPSVTSMGLVPYATYVIILTLLHHTYLILLEWLNFGSFWYFLGKVLGTTGISLVLILLTELLFYRKQKFRTNTV
jgi:rod shape-determining protein MreD